MRKPLPLVTYAVLSKFALAIMLALMATACGDDSESCSEKAGRGHSEPCCMGHGGDACGAGLFCAAFDEHTGASCHPERSQLTGAACTEDLHCASGSCNTAGETAGCRASPRAPCDPAFGCRVDAGGTRYACAGSNPICSPVGNGAVGAICLENADCMTDLCEEARCLPAGDVCGAGDGTGPCATGGIDCDLCRDDNLDRAWVFGSTSCEQVLETYADCKKSNCYISAGECLELCHAEVCAVEKCAYENLEKTYLCY